MMKSIESRCFVAGIEFSATAARMHCMSHTIHLAAIKVSAKLGLITHCNLKLPQLLEGIGIMSKSDSTKAVAAGFNYQDDVNTGLGSSEGKLFL